jgi:16S rRNA processing protein RimM
MALLDFSELWLITPQGEQESLVKGLTAKAVPKGLIVHLKGCTTREAAEKLRGYQVAVERQFLPEPEPDSFYQADLLGLQAQTTHGRKLGKVTNLLDNGAGLVLVILDPSNREYLVPFTEDCVPDVKLSEGLLLVDEIPGLLD